MAVIRRVLTLLDLTTATVNMAFSSSITLSVMVWIGYNNRKGDREYGVPTLKTI